MEREVKIPGHAGQTVRLKDFTDTVNFSNGKNIFVSSGVTESELNRGSYVNREKFLKKIAKFFNVVIYDVGYVIGGPVFEKTDVGYHRYTEED